MLSGWWLDRCSGCRTQKRGNRDSEDPVKAYQTSRSRKLQNAFQGQKRHLTFRIATIGTVRIGHRQVQGWPNNPQLLREMVI